VKNASGNRAHGLAAAGMALDRDADPHHGPADWSLARSSSYWMK